MDVWGREEDAFRASSGRWTVDRTISAAVIIALLGNLIAWVWWASSINTTSTVAAQQITALSALPERMARIEERISAMQRDVADVKTALNRRPVP